MYQVMDSVNKYRHGVLLGNYVQDKFGHDLASKGPENDAPKITSMKTTHHRTNALYKDHEIIGTKNPATTNYYDTSRQVDRNNYKKPQNQTSNDIFYKQQVSNSVPLVPNNPKKQGKQIEEGRIYDQTRYMLSNKFVSPYQAGQSTLGINADKESLKQTGNIYDIQGQQIPDILTGQIWKHANRKPDEEVYAPTRDRNQPTTKVHAKAQVNGVNPYGGSSVAKPQIQKFDQQIYKRYVLPNDKGQERDILLGHGLEINQFQRRQMATTYDLSHNQHIKPQTQVDSFYNPTHTQTAKKFHKQTLYEKSYQEKIPEYGTKALLGQEKLGRPYDPYTKTYDKNHLKNEYLRK